MRSRSLPADTSVTAAAEMSNRLGSLTPYERAVIVEQLCQDVEVLARTGIRYQHPDFDEVEINHELALRRYGPALADAAYADELSKG